MHTASSASASAASATSPSATSAASPPPPGGSCTVANTSGCAGATTLTFTDTQFVCDRPLASFGQLPLKVVLNYTTGRRYGGNGAVDLVSGCAGDANPQSIDLIVDVRGDGRTHGPGTDAIKVRLEAGYDRGIQLTGHADCGPKHDSAAHQDGVQLQGGRDITFVDFTIGDYDGGRSTCQGAGGAFFYSGAGGYEPQNIDVVRGKYIACNHSLLVGGGSGDVSDASFRSGRTDGTDPLCNGYAASEPCAGGGGVTRTRLTCQQWNRNSGRWEDQ